MKLSISFIIVFSVVVINVTSIKGSHLKHSKKKLHEKVHVHHKLNLKPNLHAYRNHRILRFKDKDLPQRCTIICPIVFPPNSGGNIYPNKPATSVTRNQTKPTTATTTSDTSEDSSSEESSEEETDLPPSTTKRTAITPSLAKSNTTNVPANKTTPKTFKIGRKVYHLNKHQKRMLSKKIKLANRHGKKAYKFRNINPVFCGIECVFEQPHVEPFPFVGPPLSLPSSGEDYSDYSDSYQEGEDTPIEATVKPFIPDDPVVAGIKPFGLVDFMGFDDFGPDGEFALEPDTYYFEDKHRINHKSGKGRNKKSHKRT